MKNDVVILQAAWCSQTFPKDTIPRLLDLFEGAAAALSQGHAMTAPAVEIKIRPTTSGGLSAPQGVAHDIVLSDAEKVVLARLRKLISEYLGIKAEFMHEDTSFLSLGLDSIKSVGLTRVLRAEGFQTSAVEILQHHTLKFLTHRLSSYHSILPSTEEYDQLVTVVRETTGQMSDIDGDVFPTTNLQAGMLAKVRVTKVSQM